MSELTAQQIAESKTTQGNISSQTALRDLQAKTLAEMSPLERKKVLAEISNLGATGGNIVAHTKLAQEQTKDIPAARELERSQYTTMDFPQNDGTIEKRQVKTSEIARAIKDGAVIADRQDQQEFQRADKLAQRERQAKEDNIKLEDDAKNAEQDILGKDKSGSRIASQEVAKVPIDEFNKKSGASYIYSYDPANAKWTGTNTKKIELIDPSGKRHKARDVYKVAQEYIRDGKVSSIEEFVLKYLHQGKTGKVEYLK